MGSFWKYRGDHIVFWLATVLFHMYTRWPLVETAGWPHFAVEVLVRNGLLAFIIYANTLYLMPKLAQRQKFFSYAFFLIVLLAFYVMAKNAHDFYLNRIVSGVEAWQFFDSSFYNLSIAVFYMAFGVALQLSKEWYRQRDLIRRIEMEKLNTELAYLRTQINPHFLFNSINTIYFQIDKNNQEARNSLSAFSEMLRYQLYECNGKEIPVEKEIAYLQHYVALQKLRKDKHYDIDMTIRNIGGFQVAPLLLIPFVENAFKHVSDFADGNRIRIHLEKEGGILHFKVFNTCETHASNHDAGTGIGLKNVRRRLALLYDGRHSLDISEGSEFFQVHLQLTL